MPSLGDVLARERQNGRPSLLVYLMAGSVPDERFRATVDALVEAGVTGLELGFPFSDPMAEGPVIQRASAEALHRGFRWKDLLPLVRSTSDKLPCAVMTYLNPILQRGPEAALHDLQASGATGLILPDLPVEAAGPFRKLRRPTGVDTVLLASPATVPDRLARLARQTEGFLYLVSRFGTTGVQGTEASLPSAQGKEGELRPLISAVHELRPKLPVLVGFGVATAQDVERHRASGADGVIVGSAVQRRLSEGEEPSQIGAFVRSLQPNVRAPSA